MPHVMIFIERYDDRLPGDPNPCKYKRVFNGNLDSTPREGELVTLSTYMSELDGQQVSTAFRVAVVENVVCDNVTCVYLDGKDPLDNYPEV